jgi:hypothetical protein
MADLDISLDYRKARSVVSQDNAAADQKRMKAAVDHMREKADRRILQFLLARFLLLNLLVEEASKLPGGLRPANHRHLWVLMQARPTDVFEKDIFAQLANILQIASSRYLKEQINDHYCKLENVLEVVYHPFTQQPVHRPLYCFLDEAQVTTKNRLGEFRSDDGKTERPLLRQIWLTLTTILDRKQMLLVLSGTGIELSSFQEILQSSFLKLHPYNLKRDIGAFDDPDAQKRYIERYLLGEESEARKAFLDRAWGWCRGR